MPFQDTRTALSEVQLTSTVMSLGRHGAEETQLENINKSRLPNGKKHQIYMLSVSLPDVRETTELSELLYCCPSALTQTLYTVPHISPETTQEVFVLIQEV